MPLDAGWPNLSTSLNDLAGSVALIVVVLFGLAVFIREQLLEFGFSRPRWILRTSHRAAARRLARDAGFLESEFFEQMGNATEVAIARRQLPNNALDHPDRLLIAALREWTIALRGDDFRGLRHYVDTMGAISSSEDLAAEFAMIAHAWLGALHKRNAIRPFDCLLSIKDGNPILVHNLVQRMRRSQSRPVRAVFCKGLKDSAKVSSVGQHETDFEGLRAFKDEQPLPRCERLHAVAIDDNCTTGESLLTGIQNFNRFVKAHPEDYPFDPIDTAVVLFVVEAKEKIVFENSGIKLHALLALGDEEMQRICTGSQDALEAKVASFKESFACAESKTLVSP